MNDEWDCDETIYTIAQKVGDYFAGGFGRNCCGCVFRFCYNE